MAKSRRSRSTARLKALEACLEEPAGRYRSLRGTGDFAAYLDAEADLADEEILTEPILDSIIRNVLGFPVDAYFPQRGKGGLKPDFTPMDLVAHPFVLDAKASQQKLETHEGQIRRYITQRSLDWGILFNLHEVRVYRRGASGHDLALSFPLLPLWRLARGEAIDVGELATFEAFCETFAFRRMGLAEQIEHVRSQESWTSRLARGEEAEVDVEFLVAQLRFLSGRLADDAAAQSASFEDFVRFRPGRETKLLEELRLLALDIVPGTDLEQLPVRVEDWVGARGLPGRAWRQYLLRVAYLALTRILLYRAWEDVDFIDSYLYDGGFDREYGRLAEDVRRVLEEAFLHGSERYHWIYGRENNYDWFRPREQALVEVLYRLSPFPLGKLDADVLGALYQTYVEEIDRDRLGQFYTPRSVVRFMLDRVGFTGPNGIFCLEGDERKPKRLLDFATGSGGFLVDAARRVIDESGIDLEEPRELKEALAAIATGFVGGEISPFPYYLTEINLLLQVSRLLGRIRVGGERAQLFTLGVLRVDTLKSKTMPARSLERLDARHRADRAELVEEQRFEMVPLDGEKLEIYRRLREED
ncbi:MAG: N-6 DNA methylase, partial [Gaiellaceae bacterium]